MRELGHRLRTQGISFGVVGLSGTVVNASLVFLLHGLLQWLLPVAVIVASEVAILNNFLWNDRWTFRRRHPSVHRLLRFNLSSLGGLVINVMVTTALTAGGLPYLVALLIGVAAATLSNFTVSTLWIWRVPQP
jgi:dolichol-phosphate mannosyltransferase